MIIFHNIAAQYTVSVFMELMFFNQIEASFSSADFGIIK